MKEHETFQRFTQSLETASTTALEIGQQRNDMRWVKVSELISEVMRNTYMLVGDGEIKQ